MVPVFKNVGDRSTAKNYRPVSLLSVVSKVFEKLVNNRIVDHLEKCGLFCDFQYGFRSCRSTADLLTVVSDRIARAFNRSGATRATDLSKAFDCLPHDLLIAKLHAYGLDMASLKLLHSYLRKRRQRVKINNTYSSWSEILFGVPQGSILGPLLFNIFLCDLFLFVSDIGIANYADDNTPHATDKHLETVLKDLEQVSDTLLKWFTDNLLKANPEKYHLLVSTNEKRHLNVGEIEISNSKCRKFLGVKIDSKLFDSHVKSLCKKASQKLSALSRVTYQLDFNQRKLLMNAFISSQFSYAPVVWMFHSRKQNHHISRIHERALRVVYKDYNSSFDELLEKDNSLKIHDRNLQKPVTEIFKVKMNLGPEIMKEVFEIVEVSHALRNELKLKSRKIHSVRYGIETASFVGARVWNRLPSGLKQCKSLELFKSKIKNWIPENCPCKLCKTYLRRIGYVQISN